MQWQVTPSGREVVLDSLSGEPLLEPLAPDPIDVQDEQALLMTRAQTLASHGTHPVATTWEDESTNGQTTVPAPFRLRQISIPSLLALHSLSTRSLSSSTQPSSTPLTTHAVPSVCMHAQVLFSISASEGRNIILRNLIGKIAANLALRMATWQVSAAGWIPIAIRDDTPAHECLPRLPTDCQRAATDGHGFTGGRRAAGDAHADHRRLRRRGTSHGRLLPDARRLGRLLSLHARARRTQGCFRVDHGDERAQGCRERRHL